ncbi:MAG: fused MFS/spermidine synthase [Chloroflexi bacterium]|nr:fused MFS/spermidine synthase [Chloroflexota bacterium]
MKLESPASVANLSLVATEKTSSLRIIFIIYFISGFCALIYQTAWQRLLGLFTGADVRSVTIIVAAYLAGLGVGSMIGGIIADRLSCRGAVRLFGLCNLAIAAFALAARLIFYDLLFLRLHMLAANLAGLMLVSGLALLVPTTLMGLSLPLLSRALVRSLDAAAQTIGRLEAINISGAALGALVGGCLLTGTLGFAGASYAGAALSTAVGVTALRVARTFPAGNSRPQSGPVLSLRGSAHLWRWSALVFLSGFTAIGLQVIWFRLLSVPVESFAYTFALLVAIVLLGDGIGTAIGTRLVAHAVDLRRWFMVTQAVIMAYVLASVLLLCALYAHFSGATTRFGVSTVATQASSVQVLLMVGLPLALLLPPNVLIGLTLPFVQKAVQTEASRVGFHVGILQLANLCGNVAGAVLTGMLFLDLFGTSGVLLLYGLIGLGFAVGAFGGSARRPRHVRVTIPVALVGALTLALVLFPSNSHLWATLHGGTETRAVIAEDSTGVTAIITHDEHAILYVGGNAQGAVPFLDVHVILGALPALVHPHPHELLIIGIGSGGTPYAAGLRAETRHVLAVELIGSQLPALTAFAQREAGTAVAAMLADPRYQLVVGDGRRELAHTAARFDVIQADAIQPWRAGSGLLYSREFFEQARTRLAAGGFMAQWTPTERTGTTFRQVFPYGVAIGTFMVIGANEPVAFDQATILARLDDPHVRTHLERGGVDPERIREFIQTQPVTFWSPATPRGGEVNTDLLPRDEYFLNN